MLLDGNAYNSSIPLFFRDFPSLRFLYIVDGFVNGTLEFLDEGGPPSIVECWLDLNPDIHGTIPAGMGMSDTLASLSLTSLGLTGQIPSELGNMQQMIQMWLYDNDLSGEIPPELGQLLSMTRLQVEGNMFNGTMPAEVCENVGFLLPLTILGADCFDPGFSCACCSCCSLSECNPDL